MLIHGQDGRYHSTGRFNSDRPKGNWGGIITFLIFVLVITGMIIYQTYFKE
jgi:cytochrome b subunit of formate dehydrogenase